MPEGDTIHKLAAAIAPRLVGQTPVRVETASARGRQTREPRRPRPVEAVYAHGKHLLVEFEGQLTLRSHLGMHGSWHRYAPRAAWRRPDAQAKVVLGTPRDVFVCFNPSEVEWLKGRGIRPANLFNRLGPDLLEAGLDMAEPVRRARAFCEPDAPLIDVLLDQRAACGIGNVYKSELLFMHRLAPLRALADTADDVLRDTFALAARLLGDNLHGGRRRTRHEDDGRGRLHVYGRGGEPCFECRRPVRYARLGVAHRPTYWCERCQR